ncbi:MAG: RNA-guided endonuclease InsQ/TnpB family protein [Promethearchaeota archaeon]
MNIHKGYKTELKLNERQKELCRRHAGCARFAYNWGLLRKITEYKETGSQISAIDLHKELNQLKKTHYKWMYEVSKCAPQEALRNLDKAFMQFFQRIQRDEKPGFPKFKSRKRGIGSFRLTGVIRVFQDSIQLPRLGRLRLKESGYLPPESQCIHILSATISEKAGRWFVSLQVQEDILVKQNFGPVVGIDVGVCSLVTISDRTVVENPKALNRFERKIKRNQKELARRKHGSKNWEKTLHRLRKTYSRITRIRKDAIHKVTTKLAKTKSIVVIEDLNVEGMRKNRRLSKSISDAGFSEIRRQLEYKTKWYGSKLKLAPRFYPSSKRCSRCGLIKNKLSLSTRIYQCKNCGLEIDRDLNASFNLELVAVSPTETINACFEMEGYSRLAVPSMMQEPRRSSNEL